MPENVAIATMKQDQKRQFMSIEKKDQLRTNLSFTGKSKSLTYPKSSPVTRAVPDRESAAQLTSA